MDIYAFAIQMEKDGELYYRELSTKSSNQGLAKIFVMLADEEVKHFKIIEELQKKNLLPEVTDSEVLSEVKNIFQEMRAGRLDFEQGHYIDTTEETNAYRKARDIEAKSREFYLEKAEEATDDQTRMVLKILAREEDKHYRIMDNIIEFVSKSEPGHWLENSEWHHLDEY